MSFVSVFECSENSLTSSLLSRVALWEKQTGTVSAISKLQQQWVFVVQLQQKARMSQFQLGPAYYGREDATHTLDSVSVQSVFKQYIMSHMHWMQKSETGEH